MPGGIVFASESHQSDLFARGGFTPSLGRTLSAQVEEVRVHGITNSLLRTARIRDFASKTGGRSGITRGSVKPAIRADMVTNQNDLPTAEDLEFLESQKNNRAWWTREQALNAIKARGYSESDIPISNVGANAMVLGEIMLQKDQERKRRDLIARGSSGRLSALMVTSIAATLTDPAEVGVSLIPYLGVKRRVAALAWAGESLLKRTAVRGAFGTAEAAIGQTIIEPFTLTAANQDLLDYTMADSFANIIIGSIAGGGLHMGIGHFADRINLARGRNLVQQRRGVSPQGTTPEALRQLDREVLTDALEAAVNASRSNRHIPVDEMMQLLGVEIRPGRTVDLPDGWRVDVDTQGRFGIFDTQGSERSLEGVASDLSVDPAVRDLARRAKDVPDLKERIERFNSKVDAIDRRNVNDLRRAGLDKQEARPLSTFIENSGGIRRSEDIGDRFAPENRPRLFRAEGGMSIKAAARLAKEAGFSVSTGRGKFLKQLARDVSGERRILTDAAEKKLDDFNQAIRGQKRPVADPAKRGDLVAFNQGYRAPENLRSFDPARAHEIENLKQRVDPEDSIESLESRLQELQETIDDVEGVADTQRAFRVIDEDTDFEIEARQRMAACITGAS